MLQRNGRHCLRFRISGRQNSDREIRETLAFNNNDGAAVAALYTEDAVLVTDEGPVYGRADIEKHYVDLFQQLHFSNFNNKLDQYHNIGTAGNEMWCEWGME